MESKNWKILAIIFIILFIVETIGIIWFMDYSVGLVQKEDTCILRCEMNDECYSYSYDLFTGLCYHYDINHETMDEINLS